MSYRAVLLTLSASIITSSIAHAKPILPNLGAGLKDLVEEQKRTEEATAFSTARSLNATAETSDSDAIANRPITRQPITFSSKGAPLALISLSGREDKAQTLSRLESMSGVEVVAQDLNYGPGVVEAFVPVAQLEAVASMQGVLAIVPSSPAIANVGKVDSQAIVQHRVDKIEGVTGEGITIGILSDSYATSSSSTTAEDDVASGDLPGVGNPFGNEEPVVVLEDLQSPTASDEGRAMAQLIHDVAPKARLGFATAFVGGEVGFANNIKALAGFDVPNAVPGFEADIIVDDIIYLAEPMFQDGIIAQAVDDVTAAGKSYFSSAGNRPSVEGYESKVRIVDPTPESLAGTNINLDGIDPALYAGGFHNFDEAGLDIAQTVTIPGADGIISFQWNEIFDPIPPEPVALLTEGVGTVPDADTFTFEGTEGQLIEIFADADDTTTGTPIPDITFSVTDPSGNLVADVDTGTNPESLTTELLETGTYTVTVAGFQGVTGDFLYRVQEVEVTEQVLTDFNLLFFDEAGNFLLSSSEQNTFTNRPTELIGLVGGTYQLVVSRANIPQGKRRNRADRIRYVGFRGFQPLEYYDYNTPMTYGHNCAAGGMGVAAYPFFPPYVPEGFTSPGPSTIFFDKNNRRSLIPNVRQKPDLAAVDGANNTFFGGDSAADEDTFPNFFGTSAAAPHAAAIAALVLEAAGGPDSVSPKKMRSILQKSAFPHDLDPYFASGYAWTFFGSLAISASGDSSLTSQLEPQFFSAINYGWSPVASLLLNGASANQTQTPPGLVFDEREGPGAPLTITPVRGLTADDITGSFSEPALPPGGEGQWQQVDFSFAPSSFGFHDRFDFGTDRDEFDAAGTSGAVGGNSADLLGGGVLIPEGTLVPSGLFFEGTFENGFSFHGELQNNIGAGYSTLDGFGFINAERAVQSVTGRGHRSHKYRK